MNAFDRGMNRQNAQKQDKGILINNVTCIHVNQDKKFEDNITEIFYIYLVKILISCK